MSGETSVTDYTFRIVSGDLGSMEGTDLTFEGLSNDCMEQDFSVTRVQAKSLYLQLKEFLD